MAGGYLHSVFESVVGNEANSPTPSTKVLYHPLRSFQPSLNAKPLMRDDELRNVDEPIMVLPEAYDPTWSLDTRLYPDLAGFELKAMLGAPVTTAGDGIITDPDGGTIPATAYRHAWTAPFGPSGASPQTTQRQVAYKDEGVFYKLKGCGTEALALDSPASGGVGLTASGPAMYLSRITDPGLTPSYEALTIPPFERAHLTIVTWLTGTAVTEDFHIAIASPMDPVRTLGAASKFPDLLEKGDGPIVVSGTIPKRHIDPDDFDALLANTPFTVKVRWQSTVNIGATSYKYALWLECNNCQYVAGESEALANRRRIGASWSWKATYGGSAGSSKLTLVNATSSYA